MGPGGGGGRAGHLALNPARHTVRGLNKVPTELIVEPCVHMIMPPAG